MRVLVLVAVTLLLGGAVWAGEAEGDWQKLYDKEGISGWKRSSPDSRFHEWRGEGLIDANFYRVVAVYMDSDRSCEWLADCVENYYLEKPDLDHQITYNRTSIGWPFKDRDLVFEEEYVFDPATRSVYDTMVSTTHPKAPESEDRVRARLLSSSFYARAEDGEHTFVRVQLLVEPMGNLPAWLVNAVSRNWPFITFRDLRQAVYAAKGFEELEDKLREAHPMELKAGMVPTPEP